MLLATHPRTHIPLSLSLSFSLFHSHTRTHTTTPLGGKFKKQFLFFFKLNRSAKREEVVDSNLAAVGTCDHVNTDVD